MLRMMLLDGIGEDLADGAAVEALERFRGIDRIALGARPLQHG